MSLSDFASVGSFVSGFAVLISLIYLALQVRQGTRATASAAMGAWLADYNSMLLKLGSDAETTSIFRKGLADMDRQSANDQTRFHALMGFRLYNCEYIFHQRKNRAFDTNYANQTLAFNAAILKTNGGRQWWERMRGHLAPDYETHMEMLMQSAKPISEWLPWFNTDSDTNSASADVRH